MLLVIAIYFVLAIAFCLLCYILFTKIKKEDVICSYRERLEIALKNRQAKSDLINDLKSQKKGFKNLTCKEIAELEAFLEKWAE